MNHPDDGAKNRVLENVIGIFYFSSPAKPKCGSGVLPANTGKLP
jgi:hypothetical protein